VLEDAIDLLQFMKDKSVADCVALGEPECVVGSNSGPTNELLYREDTQPFVEAVTWADDSKYTSAGSF